MTVKQKVSYSILQLAPVAGENIVVSVSDPGSASIVADTAPNLGTVASGFVVANPALSVNTTVTVSVTVTLPDGTVFTDSVSIDITTTVQPPKQVQIVLGLPIDQ